MLSTTAAAALRRARDEDIVPLRALTSVADIVRDVARGEGAQLVDAVALATEVALQRSQRPVPGNEVFFDHVHMTVDGYRRVAEALFDVLVTNDVVHPMPDWETSRPAIDEQVRNIVDQMTVHNAHSYLALPDGARVASVRRIDQPSVLSLQLERAS